MIKLNKLLYFTLGVTYSFSVFANDIRPITCKEFQTPLEVQQKINKLDQKFEWNNLNCKIIATKSIFPKKYHNEDFKYEKGFQIFVYQDDQLKFICLPGWICKKW